MVALVCVCYTPEVWNTPLTMSHTDVFCTASALEGALLSLP